MPCKNSLVAVLFNKVPSDAVENDCIPATIKGWTALSFAVISGKIDIVKASEISNSSFCFSFH